MNSKTIFDLQKEYDIQFEEKPIKLDYFPGRSLDRILNPAELIRDCGSNSRIEIINSIKEKNQNSKDKKLKLIELYPLIDEIEYQECITGFVYKIEFNNEDFDLFLPVSNNESIFPKFHQRNLRECLDLNYRLKEHKPRIYSLIKGESIGFHDFGVTNLVLRDSIRRSSSEGDIKENYFYDLINIRYKFF